MNIQPVKELLQNRLSVILNTQVTSIELTPVSGGSINNTYQLRTNTGSRFFLKLNSAKILPELFQKEKNGLEFIARKDCILTPAVVLYETINDHQLLLLEWVDNGVGKEQFWKKFGEQLAQLHANSNESFGFIENNYMGSLPQTNTFTSGWIDFFINHRLQPQIKLAAQKNLLRKNSLDSFNNLFKKLEPVFNPEKPSLLHGDLWNGNFICRNGELPVLIDPAVYFGHRSVDLAMTTLFGGFDNFFYEAYHYHFPLPANHREQWEVCNLYPLLIHLNLFGESYMPGITSVLKKFS